jgi:hypothetical protein
MAISISPYQVKWVVIDNYSHHIWKYQEKAINKLGFSVLRQYGEKFGIAVKHYPNDEAVKVDAENIKKACEILYKKGVGAGAVITDKQFGMIDMKDIKSAITISTIKQREQFTSI